ncbi:unnamed protein product [Spirodela intermedia]|uniref:Uncharacterized protein n=1 Tax=Spirodela intermedia TaxID=51605 RepID=A0A7I8KFR0_SPIIN|nr:unnamed protein product [Spirodela intermedia]
MPLTRSRLTADALGTVSAALSCLFIITALLCVAHSVYFRRCIIRKQRVLPQLAYFNGPWATRIALILIAIWWAAWEIARLSLLRGRGRILADPAWQKGFCKYYVLSNMGFAEPALFLILALLLRASLLNEPGALGRRWNSRTLFWALLICLPLFILHLGILMSSSSSHGVDQLPAYFWSTAYPDLTDERREGVYFCTYPLLSTALVGLYEVILVVYVSYRGVLLVSAVVNIGLKRRVGVLLFSVVACLPLRVALLGISVLLAPGSPGFDGLVFSAFLTLLWCAAVAVWVLVYRPVADSMGLRGLAGAEQDH